MKKGLLIVYSGVSGVGKGTILNELMPMEDLNLAYSVSMTTRKPREGEVDGVNYFFVDKKRFLEAVKNGDRKPGNAQKSGQRQLDADEIAAIQRMMQEV